MGGPSPAPGWYPDPHGTPRQRYFDGVQWTANYAPLGPGPAAGNSKGPAVAVGVCLLIAVGLVMSFQSVSLMTGSGLVWTGVAVVAAGTALAFILGGATWVRVVAVIVLVIALFNAIYIEHQMSERRDELTRIFHH